jgi:TrmH family RNA methyltransferase
MKPIASRDNPAFKALHRLVTNAAERRRRGLSLIEGAHLVASAFAAGLVPEALAIRRGAEGGDEVAALAARLPASAVLVLAENLFDALSNLETPAGVLAAVPTPPGRPVPRDASLVLLLEDVQDPGNVGTLLRSAAAAGAGHVLLAPTCAFAWSPKVLRAGQGAHFALNIVEGADLAAFLAAWRGASVALAGGGATDLWDLDLRGPVAFLVGNEGAGLTPAVLAAATHRARIPMPGGTESLNAGVAGSLALFECVRQRRSGGEF